MWVEELENGKYRAVERYTDYLTGNQKKVSVTIEKNTAQSRKAAQRTLNTRIAEKYQSAKNHDYTLKELVDEYRKGRKGEIKESSYKSEYYMHNTLINILGADVVIGRMTASYIKNSFSKTDFDAAARNTKISHFKSLLRWGHQNNLLSADDIAFLSGIGSFSVSQSHREKIQDKFLESKELKALISGIKSPLWSLLTEFLALTGMRIGEAIALRKEDVSLKNRNICITKTYDFRNNIITDPKTYSSKREIHIQDELVDTIKNLKQLMLIQKIKYGYHLPDLFLCNEKGRHIGYEAYYAYLRRKSQEIIGRPISPHVLRHTHTSLLAEQGVPLEVISRRLGHEDCAVTRAVYFHATRRLQEQDNQLINEVKIM